MDNLHKVLVLKIATLAIESIVRDRAAGRKPTSLKRLIKGYGRDVGVTYDEVKQVLDTPLKELFQIDY